jgi:hypothetical protein
MSSFAGSLTLNAAYVEKVLKRSSKGNTCSIDYDKKKTKQTTSNNSSPICIRFPGRKTQNKTQTRRREKISIGVKTSIGSR